MVRVRVRLRVRVTVTVTVTVMVRVTSGSCGERDDNAQPSDPGSVASVGGHKAGGSSL